MWIFSYYTHYYQKKFRKSPCKTSIRGFKVAVQHPPPSLNEGLALINTVFCPTSSTTLREEILKHFAGINFPDLTCSGDKKGIYFREFS